MRTTLDSAEGKVTTQFATPALAGDSRVHRRLRVLHVINCLGLGGTENALSRVTLGLADGFEHYICTTRGWDPDFAQTHFSDTTVYDVGRHEKGLEITTLKLASIMKRIRPDIVHSRNWGAIEALPAARIARVPVAIHSEHGYDLDMINGMPLRRRIIRRGFYGCADGLFAVTDELRHYHARQAWMAPNRFRVLHNGVDTAKFAPRRDFRGQWRLEFNISAESFVIGTVGRMVPIKNQSILLEATELLAAKGIDIRLLLAGAGPELEPLRNRVNSSASLRDRVVFAGQRREIAEILNAMDVFVLPSISEGMSNTLLEAMASGIPVVASKAGGNPEVVGDSGAGFLFEATDVNALVSRIELLARDTKLRDACGRAARKRIVESFSLDVMIQNYRDLYTGLADRKLVMRESVA